MVLVRVHRRIAVTLHVVVAVLCSLFTFPGDSSAANAIDAIPGYNLQRWGIRDQAPVDIKALQQTADGFLWLGSSTGLYRFDGNRFERFEPPLHDALPSNGVSALLAVPEQGLWVATAAGDLLLLQGHAMLRSLKLPVEVGSVYRLVLGENGVIYGLSNSALFEVDSSGWRRLGQEEVGIRGSRLYNAALDEQGTLWLATSDGIFKRARTANQFVSAFEHSLGHGWFGKTRDGALWYCDELTGLLKFSGANPPQLWPEFKGYVFAVTDQQTGWIFFAGHLHRLRLMELLPGTSAALQSEGVVATVEALASTVVRTALEDREGNIWLGSSQELIQLTAHRFTEPTFPGGAGGLAPAVGGGIWLISHSRGLVAVDTQLKMPADAGLRLTHIHRAHNGDIWLGGQRRDELLRIADQQLSVLKLPRSFGDSFVNAIATQRNGALWIALNPGSSGKTLRYFDGIWEEQGGLTQLPMMPATHIAVDEKDRVWLGYRDNQLAIADGQTVRSLGHADGIAVGTIRFITFRQDHVYLGGEDGVVHQKGGRFVPLMLANDTRLIGVGGMLAARNGDLWLNQNEGIVRIPALELDRLETSDTNIKISAELFDYRDGRDGVPIQYAPLPSIAQAEDGTIWVAAKNLLRIEPEQIRRNHNIPPVHLTHVEFDGQQWPVPAQGIRIPAGINEFTVGYTALSLVNPERMQFRFQLEGVDKTWRQGTRDRRAVYTNISPGSYRLTVAASNNDGVWNEAGLSTVITVDPMFYQTLWFRFLCLLAVLFLLIFLLRVRSRAMVARIRDRLRERSDERERIARELHDTLLQGMQGLILHFQSVAEDLPADDVRRVSMEQALDQADALLREGRERVSDLRFANHQAAISTHFHAMLGMVNERSAIRLRVREAGTRRRIVPLVQTEMLRIGQEAITNALRHANASRINVEILYRHNCLRLRVRDDGCGIPRTLAEKGRAGHWGISGMRERAAKLGARLQIGPAKGKGTAVDLFIPGRVAYGRRKRLHRLLDRLRRYVVRATR